MATILLHNPWVQFYLLYVGGLWVVFICAYFRNPPVTCDDSRTPPNETAQGEASPLSCPRSQEPCSVSSSGPRKDKEVKLSAWLTIGVALCAGVAAPISGKRRDDDVVAPSGLARGT
jgi:hypothetical protein